MYSGTNGSGATANASQSDHARPLITIVFTAPFVRCHFLFLANSFLVRHSWGILLCIIFSPDTYYLAILSWLLTAYVTSVPFQPITYFDVSHLHLCEQLAWFVCLSPCCRFMIEVQIRNVAYYPLPWRRCSGTGVVVTPDAN